MTRQETTCLVMKREIVIYQDIVDVKEYARDKIKGFRRCNKRMRNVMEREFDLTFPNGMAECKHSWM